MEPITFTIPGESTSFKVGRAVTPPDGLAGWRATISVRVDRGSEIKCSSVGATVQEAVENTVATAERVLAQ